MLLSAPCSLALSDKGGSIRDNFVSVVEWRAKNYYGQGDK